MRTTSLYWLTCAFLIALLPGCRSTKTLTEGQYMLRKNTVTVVDSKDPQIDNLKTYVRPLTNKKFMGVFNLKTMCYTGGQPRLDPKTGEWKDSKFRQWLRNRIGEPPVLLDLTEIQSSISQLGVVMNKYGYFDSDENCLTKTDGIFVAGDCRSKYVRQMATAISDGATAALAACRYINERT